ncbi:hypothetical protein B6U83_03595 [Thermoplasmatales archaeon ex4484_36]|nr:MAG: hypothetical protein B6U83_03595 [Thermoplasmatales archaeon ex4484_36]
MQISSPSQVGQRPVPLQEGHLPELSARFRSSSSDHPSLMRPSLILKTPARAPASRSPGFNDMRRENFSSALLMSPLFNAAIPSLLK